MVPFKETINTKQELIEACKKGFEDYTNRRISKNDFCMYFGFTHGKAITTFYEGNYEQLLIDGGFISGSSAYFSAGINAWKNLRDDIYTFPPYSQNDSRWGILDDEPLQQIFYGAPGTGKSYKIKELTGKANVIRTTFHPDSDYSTFVGCYKPTTKLVNIKSTFGGKAVNVVNEKGEPEKETKIVYEFVEQAFLQAYVNAWKLYAEAGETEVPTEPKKQYLIIEEINRGNCAQIFGDLFQLLDRNDENGFSDYYIKADSDMCSHLKKAFEEQGITHVNVPSIGGLSADEAAEKITSGEILVLPNNLYIWATMNTSDQSLFPIDSAFKRRWEWQYVPITNRNKGWIINIDGRKYDWWKFVDKINEIIEQVTYSEDKKLGYFFCKAKDGVIDAKRFVGKVLFFLWNDVFKDTDGEGDAFYQDGKKIPFSQFYGMNHNGETYIMVDDVNDFMQRLGIEPINATNENDDNEEANANEDDTQNDTNTKDYSSYSINGQGNFPKRIVAREVLKKYVNDNPTLSAEEVVQNWLGFGINISNLVETKDMYEQRRLTSNDPNYDSRSFEVPLANGEVIYVYNQFNPYRITELMTKVNALNIGIHIEKIQ